MIYSDTLTSRTIFSARFNININESENNVDVEKDGFENAPPAVIVETKNVIRQKKLTSRPKKKQKKKTHF